MSHRRRANMAAACSTVSFQGESGGGRKRKWGPVGLIIIWPNWAVSRQVGNKNCVNTTPPTHTHTHNPPQPGPPPQPLSPLGFLDQSQSSPSTTAAQTVRIFIGKTNLHSYCGSMNTLVVHYMRQQYDCIQPDITQHNNISSAASVHLGDTLPCTMGDRQRDL